MGFTINIGIGIVIGIVTTILFFIITKKQQPVTIPIPAIPTCGFGYTLTSDGSECIDNVPNIPTICPDIDGHSFTKNDDGRCYMKCPRHLSQTDRTCESPNYKEDRVRVDATCPLGYKLDEGDKSINGDNTCIGIKKFRKPNYSCEESQTLIGGKCFPRIFE
jgi:hypothetical protein